MIITALDCAVQTPSETERVRLKVFEPAITTRFFVRITPMLSIEKSSKENKEYFLLEIENASTACVHVFNHLQLYAYTRYYVSVHIC